ncbi:MAG: PAQR family membrane homeostasis protein TrhA [Pseudomonadota bacterium]
MTANTHSTYTLGEEIANAIIHGLGMAAAIVALTLLLVKGMPVLSGWELAGVAVYGGSLVALFLSSTLYHSITHQGTKDVFKRLDHCSIYLLIAGTYTPLMMITLHTPAAYALLAVVWALAIAGVLFKAFFVHRHKRLSLATYLLMGWLSLFVFYELWEKLPRPGFVLLLAGGLCFTVGAAFYAAKQYRYTHAIWHLWVVAGAACHCVMIGVYVIPSS